MRTFANNVCETSITTGTGAYELQGPVLGCQSFVQGGYVDNDKPVYCVRNRANSQYEYNRNAVFMDEPGLDTLARGTFISSNANTPVPWTVDDLPLTIYIPTDGEMLNAIANFVPGPNLWVPSRTRIYVDKGANNYTAVPEDRDVTFQFDTTAASRTLTLPNIADVPMGYTLGVVTVGNVFPMILNPGTVDGIDQLADDVSLEVNVPYIFDIRSNGSNWTTDLRGVYYEKWGAFSAATNVDFKNLPNSINVINGSLTITAIGANGISVQARVGGTDQVFDTGGSDYYYQIWVGRTTPNNDWIQANSSANAMVIQLSPLSNTNPHPAVLKFSYEGFNDASVRTVMMGSVTMVESTNTNQYLAQFQTSRLETARHPCFQFYAASSTFTGHYRMQGRP